MINTTNYSFVQANVMGNMQKYLPIMASFKTDIQRAIIPLLSSKEKQDIVNCTLNITVVDKLVNIGKEQYRKTEIHDDNTLYCLCMAIGTIIKEYDWGTHYVLQDGMIELATKIAE